MASQREEEAAEGLPLPLRVSRRNRIRHKRLRPSSYTGHLSVGWDGRSILLPSAAICCQNSLATGAMGRIGHANSVSRRQGPEWESLRPKSGHSWGKWRCFGEGWSLSWGQERGRDRRRKGRKTRGKGVERADAGSWPSRRRVSTAGAEDPLPIVRLPERDGYRTPLLRVARSLIQ
jgi:hypothetical protein